MRGLVERWDRFLARETSTRSAALLRVIFPLLWWTRLGNELLPVRDLDPARLVLSLNFFASTSLMLIGWKSRWTTAWVGLTVLVATYGFAGDPDVGNWGAHHVTFLAHCTVLLALTPCGRSFSLDRWLLLRECRARSVAPPPERGPTWGLGLIALQTSTVYAFGAWDKTSWPFLSGQRLEHIFRSLYWGADPIEIPGIGLFFVCVAVGVVVVEYGLAVTLFLPRFQRASIAVGLVLHALIYLLLPVRIFTLATWATYLAYLDPDRVDEALRPLLDASDHRLDGASGP